MGSPGEETEEGRDMDRELRALMPEGPLSSLWKASQAIPSDSRSIISWKGSARKERLSGSWSRHL